MSTNIGSLRELDLRSFFLQELTIEELALLVPSMLRREGGSTGYRIEEMPESFHVQPSHLLLLCDGLAAGKLLSPQLSAIAFALLASETFEWDPDSAAGQAVADVLSDWACPEINLPITPENALFWRNLLEAASDQPA